MRSRKCAFPAEGGVVEGLRVDARPPRPLARGLAYPLLFLCIALSANRALLRPGDFSNDAMNYVNVARNIAAGRGISQPSLGFNQVRIPPEAEIPAPFTAQAPLYPMLIASLGAAGVPWRESAQGVTALSFLAALGLAMALARRLYGEDAARLSVVLLLSYHPFREVGHLPLSETTGIAWTLASLLFLIRARQTPDGIQPGLAGLAAGLAFATRYALFPLLPVGLVFLAAGSGRWREKLAAMGCYAAAAFLPAACVLGRNLSVLGAFVPPQNPSGTDLAGNAGAAFSALAANYLSASHAGIQLSCMGACLLGLGFLAWARGEMRAGLAGFFSGGRWLLPLWSAGYLAFLLWQRTRIHFDPINPRLIAPAGTILILPAAAALIHAAGIFRLRPSLPALLLALAVLGREAHSAWMPGRIPPHAGREDSQRMDWIAAHVTRLDLVIGDNTVDIPFHLGYPHTLSFSPYPYTDHPTYRGIRAYCLRQGWRYRGIFLVLRKEYPGREEWMRNYGGFFADLAAGKGEDYPGVFFQEELNDALVYRLRF